jgi:hypothetical protein
MLARTQDNVIMWIDRLFRGVKNASTHKENKLRRALQASKLPIRPLPASLDF